VSSGWNGSKFAKQKAIDTAPAKFNGFNGIAFGPDGRLYVGVDVGLTDGNDYGPTTTSPYRYDILSISPTGTGLKVFVTGIRQPWQFAFPEGSDFPLVSALGQDKGAKNPPDFVVKVHPGDDYGFPKCNRAPGSP
jgi:glucose/arabinose dehydrogenase